MKNIMAKKINAYICAVDCMGVCAGVCTTPRRANVQMMAVHRERPFQNARIFHTSVVGTVCNSDTDKKLQKPRELYLAGVGYSL
jgi:hypothetical protein